ncbi:MAG: hypothetical protein NT007_02700 [Candidatus Kapabacteria bacterium]|nr:hypothetical protein [Candidatus Kapabacteria bacterium]
MVNKISMRLMFIGIIVVFSMLGCQTYYIPVNNFKEQFKNIDSTKLFLTNVVGPLGSRYTYYRNPIKIIKCFDKENNPIDLPNSPSIEIRFTDKDNNRTIFYFDTIYMQDSLIYGTQSRFITSIKDILYIPDIILIEVQDGHKDFQYY